MIHVGGGTGPIVIQYISVDAGILRFRENSASDTLPERQELLKCQFHKIAY